MAFHYHDPMTGAWAFCAPGPVPKVPSLFCLTICAPAVMIDDLLLPILAGKGIGGLPFKSAKVVARWTLKVGAPVLACLSLPAYIECVKICEAE